ncbi:MAG: phosphoribosylamine--glycine ligase [Bdellovibrio sp.]
MKIVVVGKGGREHALAEALKRSPTVQALWVCPGNAGMVQAGLSCASVETPTDIVQFCREQGVTCVVVGPEAAILSDLKQRLEALNIFCFAPSPEVARLESSKLFCKQILRQADVPTAACTLVANAEQALLAVRTHNFAEPLVVKADGLAAGKGVWVCENLKKAEEAVQSLGAQFGYPLLLEECLIGRELSAFALCDGEDFVILGTACDYKRITPDPFSANTGGMGAYSPCDFISAEDEKNLHEIFSRTLRCLQQQGLPYQGFLFAGLMKTEKGLYVLEYNVRMGDPETQALLPRLRSDFAELIHAAVTHRLPSVSCQTSSEVAVHVVAVSQGYPQSEMLLNQPLQIRDAAENSSSHIYFAGVQKKDQQLINTGGRVVGVTALASSREEARRRAYVGLERISFSGMYFREDIGQ